MPHSLKGAYDCFDSLTEAKSHYKRCRSIKCFILSDKGIQKDNPVCAVCDQLLIDFPEETSEGYRGNRCEYFPKNKKIAAMHYICAWSSLLKKVFNNLY